MKKVLLVFIIFCSVYRAHAQKVYFIYLQSENNAPFFVKISDKIHSSTSSGYIILSNLRDSTYSLSLGFPGDQNSESVFNIPVESKDKGLLIKNFEGETGLFDLQTMNIYKRFNPESNTAQTTIKTDSFSRRLSQAAKDESLLTTVIKKETKPEEKKETPPEVKADTIIEEVKKEVETQAIKDTVVEKSKPIVEEEKKEIPIITTPKADTIRTQVNTLVITPPAADTMVTQVIKEVPVLNTNKEPSEIKNEPAEPYKKTVVKRRSESSTTEGFGLVFLDIGADFTDTIRLLIPNPKIPFRQETAEPSKVETVNTEVTERTNDNRVSDSEIITEERNPATKKSSSCRSVANESEFRKLRKNMAGERDDDEMISEAKKMFRTKCFTSEQIRNLSALFLTDASKYQFFDAAYNYASDPEEYTALQSEIRDEYYLKRFKALVGQ